MPTGTVKYVEPNGRWGFISRDDKLPKVFIHIDTIHAAGYETLEKGWRWRFDLSQGNDERCSAVNLIPI